jgi:hypothetical protein
MQCATRGFIPLRDAFTPPECRPGVKTSTRPLSRPYEYKHCNQITTKLQPNGRLPLRRPFRSERTVTERQLRRYVVFHGQLDPQPPTSNARKIPLHYTTSIHYYEYSQAHSLTPLRKSLLQVCCYLLQPDSLVGQKSANKSTLVQHRMLKDIIS